MNSNARLGGFSRRRVSLKEGSSRVKDMRKNKKASFGSAFLFSAARGREMRRAEARRRRAGVAGPASRPEPVTESPPLRQEN